MNIIKISTPEEIKKVLCKSRKIELSKLKFFISSKGYLLTNVNGKTNSFHRLVWEKHNGKIPDGMVIHHINEKRKDNRLENLQMMTFQEHMSLHKKLRKEKKRAFE